MITGRISPREQVIIIAEILKNDFSGVRGEETIPMFTSQVYLKSFRRRYCVPHNCTSELARISTLRGYMDMFTFSIISSLLLCGMEHYEIVILNTTKRSRFKTRDTELAFSS